MKARRLFGFLVCGAIVAAALAAQGAGATSSLSRSDQPLVLTGVQIGNLNGIMPEDLVAFRHTGTDWAQIPVQVDEVKYFSLRNAYPSPFPGCGGLCFNPGNRVWWEEVYADPNTLVGAETDQMVSVVSGPICSGIGDQDLGNVPLTCTRQNSSTIDDNDEIALMVKDAGDQVPATSTAPAGVLGNGVEIRALDPLDDGAGYIYLFQRDPGHQPVPLDPTAGVSYVTYKWVVNHLQNAHSSDPNATENFYKTEYRFNGAGGAGNPESSYVETAHYRREMTGRWTDNVLIIKRGGVANPVNILDRHDASITTDNVSACTRYQGTFDGGEMAYLTSKGGPIRVIRAYLGTNSGPFVERRQIFYESSEYERIDLRVHPIPGPTEVWNWNANAVGMRYRTLIGSDRIDNQGVPAGGFVGVPGSGNSAGTYVGGPAVLPKSWNWQAIDQDLPTDPARGGLTFTIYFDTNNPDPVAHSLYRDSGFGGCKGGTANATRYYGAILDQAPGVMSDTDTPTGALATSGSAPQGTQQTFLIISRTVHYEETGTTDGPKRVSEDSTPLEVVTTNR